MNFLREYSDHTNRRPIRQQKILLGREDCRPGPKKTIYKNLMVFHWFLGIDQFVWARVVCGIRYGCHAAVDCSGTIQKIHMRKIRVSQGDGHAWKRDGFHDPGAFDEDFLTLQSPWVRADAQCFKITWLEELASESNTIQAWEDITGQGRLQARTQENYM